MDVDEGAWMAVGLGLAAFGETAGEAEREWLKFVRAIRRAYDGPGKLCIDGHAYHRRQRRRTKGKGKR